MNRNERRRIKAETKQENKSISDGAEWYKKLPNNRKRFIGWMIEQGVIKNENTTMAIIDECFIAAMIDILELEIDVCKKVIDKSSEFMFEAKKVLESERKDYFMKVYNEEMREEIKDIAKDMLRENPKQKTINISDELIKNYNLPTKDLHVIVALARKELKAEKEEVEKEQLLNEFGQENEKLLNNVVAAGKEEIKTTLSDESEQGLEIVQSKTKLKVLNTVQVIQGEYDIYEKSVNGVKTSQRIFNDIKDLEQYKVGVQAEIEQIKDTLKEQIEELQNKLRKVNEDDIREHGFISELEEVFNL